MPGAITSQHKTWNPFTTPIRIAVIESNLRVSGHACTVFHVMLEDTTHHFSLVRFISDFIELDCLLNQHFPKHRISLPKLTKYSNSITKKPSVKNMLFSHIKKRKCNSKLLEEYLYRCIHSQIGFSSLFRDFLSAQRDEDRVISKLTVRQIVAQHHQVTPQTRMTPSCQSNKQQEHVSLPPSPPSSISIHKHTNTSIIQFPEYIQDSDLTSYTSSSIYQSDSMSMIDTTAPATSPNDKIDDFELIKVLGKGATGKVILVRDQQSKKLFALKTITKAWNITQREVDHIRMERDILATLSDIHHPFLVRLHSAFQDYQNLYLVLDYHAGADLATLLQRYIRFPAEQCRLYAAEMVMGLQELHRHHILYRDLKPENVLLAADGHIVLTDFGLSKMFMDGDKYDHRTSTFCGTPEYLAPEIILQEEEYSYAADFWSLGTMLYEMLTGITPFYAATVDEMYDRVVHDDLLFPSKFDPEAMDLIAGLLERDPLTRLGAGFGGVFELRTHTYFAAHLNWKDVYAKAIQPIYVPMRRSETDLSNFDPDFLNMSTHIKEENDEAVMIRQRWLPENLPAGLNAHAYRGFSYIDAHNNDDIPFESEISFFSSEYMMYDDENDDDDYNQIKVNSLKEDDHQHQAVPHFFYGQASAQSSTCSFGKPLTSSISNMTPYSNFNESIRNSLIINASVKEENTSAFRS